MIKLTTYIREDQHRTLLSMDEPISDNIRKAIDLYIKVYQTVSTTKEGDEYANATEETNNNE